MNTHRATGAEGPGFRTELGTEKGPLTFLLLGCFVHPIKQRREAKGWTPSELARRLGVDRKTLWQWERGVLPRGQSLWKLSEVLKVDHLDLVNEILAWESTPRRSLTRTH